MATLKKNSISLRLEGNQRLKLDYLSERNYHAKPAHLIRAGINLMVALAERNKGQVPLPENVALLTDLARRAGYDKRRTA
jgi:hypothetical protein